MRTRGDKELTSPSVCICKDPASACLVSSFILPLLFFSFSALSISSLSLLSICIQHQSLPHSLCFSSSISVISFLNLWAFKQSSHFTPVAFSPTLILRVVISRHLDCCFPSLLSALLSLLYLSLASSLLPTNVSVSSVLSPVLLFFRCYPSCSFLCLVKCPLFTYFPIPSFFHLVYPFLVNKQITGCSSILNILWCGARAQGETETVNGISMLFIGN